ncbi:MAG: PCRF domain-containing protein, partial [Clostridiales bacterium]|nr:PCRF domain-containing protein [Clostridiales bacterium]
MLQFEELRLRLEGMKPDIDDLSVALGVERMEKDIQELDASAAVEGFWDDMETAQKILQRSSALKARLADYQTLVRQYQDALTMVELADEEGDESLLAECTADVNRVQDNMESQRLSTLLSGEYDAKNAILTFHAGAGGTEAQDWAEMLYRMYTHWAERHGFKYRILDYLDGDEAGLKSASIEIEGMNAFGYLKGESGVHRLVRVSPFDSS